MVERHLFNLDANGSSVKMELEVMMFACGCFMIQMASP